MPALHPENNAKTLGGLITRCLGMQTTRWDNGARLDASGAQRMRWRSPTHRRNRRSRTEPSCAHTLHQCRTCITVPALPSLHRYGRCTHGVTRIMAVDNLRSQQRWISLRYQFTLVPRSCASMEIVCSVPNTYHVAARVERGARDLLSPAQLARRRASVTQLRTTSCRRRCVPWHASVVIDGCADAVEVPCRDAQARRPLAVCKGLPNEYRAPLAQRGSGAISRLAFHAVRTTARVFQAIGRI